MRGFPLLNFLLVLGALGLALVGVMRVTSGGHAAVAEGSGPVAVAGGGPVVARLAVVLSGPASRVRVATLDGTSLIDEPAAGARVVRQVELAAGTGALVVQVDWAEPAGGQRFAKLTLEPERLATLERTFDAPGSLDDVWEFAPLNPPTP